MIRHPGDQDRPPIGNRILCATLLGSLVLLGACALPATTPDQPDIPVAIARSSTVQDTATNTARPVSATDRTMLNNLAVVIAQIFNPVETTVQINKSNTDPTTQYIIATLGEMGFGIQRVSADQGANYLSYTRRENDQNLVAVSIAVGGVVVSRAYQLIGRNVVAPASVMRVSGTRAPITVQDVASSRFEVRDPSLSQVQYVASLGLDEQAPVISLITPMLVDSVASQSTSGPSLQALNSNKIEVNNLFYGNTSTFSSILEGYERIDRQIIVFGNDSLVLGDVNKQLIDQFVDTQLRHRDIINLVGCSNGPTALDIGNEGLALGRARRVTEALLARGVLRDQILDEGCWAPTSAGDRFPGRGVVLELWRRNA
ncbi:MAG: hypothetical protein HKN42_11730 [Granulosicoccus sp.]|nr:hypothetical protein [Granulosicoccus sp.]